MKRDDGLVRKSFLIESVLLTMIEDYCHVMHRQFRTLVSEALKQYIDQHQTYWNRLTRKGSFVATGPVKAESNPKKLRSPLTMAEFRIKIAKEANWFSLKKAVLDRDDYTCQHCGMITTELEIHHIKKRRLGGGDTLANLIALCPSCHADADHGRSKRTPK